MSDAKWQMPERTPRELTDDADMLSRAVVELKQAMAGAHLRIEALERRLLQQEQTK